MESWTAAMAIPPSVSEYITGDGNQTSASTPSSSTSGCVSTDETSDSKRLPIDLAAADRDLLLNKNASAGDLEDAIRRCKELVLDTEQCSDERTWLVRHLVELRLRLQERKDADEDPGHPLNTPGTEIVRVHLGHRFAPQCSKPTTQTGAVYCDHCTATVWVLLQAWYVCEDCGFSCHHKCVDRVIRVCANVRAAENPGYEREICPERGLHSQNYRCFECRTAINMSSAWTESRLCDYDGNYYCARCHWNATAIIPARAIHNWDLSSRRVCQSCAFLLRLTCRRPVVPLNRLNARLFGLVHELSVVQKQRDRLVRMKKYLVLCRFATERQLLLALGDRPHMAEGDVGVPSEDDAATNGNGGAQLYSMQDLIDTQNGSLTRFLQDVIDIFVKHIKTDCQVCVGRGHLCELCGNSEVIFPFDDCAVVCEKCQAVFHRACWVRKGQTCRRCERRGRKNVDGDAADERDGEVDDETDDEIETNDTE